MKLTLLNNGDIYSPEHEGKRSILYCGQNIIHVGDIDEKKFCKAGVDVEVIDLKGHIISPGLIDPHAHLLGGSGENGGFSSQTPEISLSELVQAGITTVVGTLGADTTMKTMPGLLGKVKGLNEENLSAYCYTGGYTVPPSSIMKTVSDDIMFIDEVIATGEIAISDERSNEPDPQDLARFVVDTHMAGVLANKAGVTHFHVGEGPRRLQCLFDLLEYAPDIKPEWLYPTHINRNEKLIEKAVLLTRKKAFVDMDVVDGQLFKWLKVYTKHGGKFEQLTVSSDASVTSPRNILDELRRCVIEHGMKLERLLPLVTCNPAKALKFKDKGRIKVGYEPSFIVLDKKTLDLVHVISRGKFMLRDGHSAVREKFLEESNRSIHLVGDRV